MKRFLKKLLPLLATAALTALALTACRTTTPEKGCTDHVDANEDAQCDFCGTRVGFAGLDYVVTKHATLDTGSCVYPTTHIAWNGTTYRGSYITYTFTLTNTATTPLAVTLCDTVPAYTAFVSGCDDHKDGKLTWAVTIPAKQTITVSYRVVVTAGPEALGERIESKKATANGITVPCDTLFIKNVFNETDVKYIEKATLILSSSTYTALDFAKFAYTVAFTNAKAITALHTGTPAEMLNAVFAGDETLAAAVAPHLYGGSALSTPIEQIPGTPNKELTAADLISGDLLLLEENGTCRLFIVCAEDLFDITARATKVEDPLTILKNAKNATRYAVIRPSMTMQSFTPSDPEEKPEVLNAYQEALVQTANAYLLRGEALQYEDVYFGLTSKTGEHRWAVGQKAPEEYTDDEWGYVNCAVFTYDVYLQALGYTLPKKMYTTANLASKSEDLGMCAFYFRNLTPGKYTDEQKLAIEKEFMETLEVGDIIVVRRRVGTSGTSGHAMLYVGNGRFIHSGGSNYAKTDDGVGYEVYEPTIRCHKVADYIFNPSSVGGNPFRDGKDEYGTTYVTDLVLVRPLNKFSGDVPENTQKRTENLTGIRAEKRSDHASSTTVNAGDTITFTFSIFNLNAAERTLEITDKAPVGTTYLSGAQQLTEDTLSWSVTVGAGQTATVSYTVLVNDVADGTLIDGCDARIGGVAFRCAAIRVKNTLTAAEQAAVKAAIEALRTEGTACKGLALVNEIYHRALGVSTVFADTNINNVMRDGTQSVFAQSGASYSSKPLSMLQSTDTYYARMLVDHLYGGMRFDSSAKLYDRTRLLKPHNLVVGDILIGRTSSAEHVYIYAGDGVLISLTDGIGKTADFTTLSERIMYYGRDFAVLRPSFVMQ